MSSSQVYVSLPVYEGFLKFVIWKEPDSVSRIIWILEMQENIKYLKDKVKLQKDKKNIINFPISRLSAAMVCYLQIAFKIHSLLESTSTSHFILVTDMLQFLAVESMMWWK